MIAAHLQPIGARRAGAATSLTKGRSRGFYVSCRRIGTPSSGCARAARRDRGRPLNWANRIRIRPNQAQLRAGTGRAPSAALETARPRSLLARMIRCGLSHSVLSA